VHELGWHIQINGKPELIVEIEALLLRLPSPLVFDHRAHVPRDAGLESPAYKTMRKLIDQGRTW
jgi:D-galactarolactone isomerase